MFFSLGCYNCHASEAKRELLEETLSAAHQALHRKDHRIQVQIYFASSSPMFPRIWGISFLGKEFIFIIMVSQPQKILDSLSFLDPAGDVVRETNA